MAEAATPDRILKPDVSSAPIRPSIRGMHTPFDAPAGAGPRCAPHGRGVPGSPPDAPLAPPLGSCAGEDRDRRHRLRATGPPPRDDRRSARPRAPTRLYAAYTVGIDGGGRRGTRSPSSLAREALWLARVLADHVPPTRKRRASSLLMLVRARRGIRRAAAPAGAFRSPRGAGLGPSGNGALIEGGGARACGPRGARGRSGALPDRSRDPGRALRAVAAGAPTDWRSIAAFVSGGLLALRGPRPAPSAASPRRSGETGRPRRRPRGARRRGGAAQAGLPTLVGDPRPSPRRRRSPRRGRGRVRVRARGRAHDRPRRAGVSGGTPGGDRRGRGRGPLSERASGVLDAPGALGLYAATFQGHRCPVAPHPCASRAWGRGSDVRPHLHR